MGEILETERLRLRTWTFADAERLFEICSEPETMRRIGDGEPYHSIETARAFLNWAVLFQTENGFCRWAVVEKQSGSTIGSCGFARLDSGEIDLGYLFERKSWGKGFATEAARACLDYGFRHIGFEKIVAVTGIDHKDSQNVLRKIGFMPRGIVKTDIGGENIIFEIANQSKISR